MGRQAFVIGCHLTLVAVRHLGYRLEVSTAQLIAAPTYDVFLANPLGHYFVGGQLIAWAASPTLIGFTLWGSPTEAEVESITRPIDLPRPSSIAPKCNVLVNVRRVTSVDFATFEHLIAVTRQRLTAYESRIARQAIVRPHGLIGAVAEGFANLVGPRYGWRVVDSTDRALEWLGAASMPVREQVDHLERLADEARGLSPELARLRAWFTSQPSTFTIDNASRALHLSRRSLQRMLLAAGTSFREESERHTLALAVRYLRETDYKVEVIARRLGFANPSSFAVFLRRHTGETPRQLRATANAATR